MARAAAQLSRCLSVFALLCGLSVSNTCDGAGRATQVQAPPLSDGTQVVTQTVYDRAGNAVGTINPLGNRTDVTYNARNRNVRTTGTPAPDGVTGGMTRPLTDWSYDGVGNVLTVTDPRNYVTGRIRGQLLTLDVSVRCQELTPSFCGPFPDQQPKMEVHRQANRGKLPKLEAGCSRPFGIHHFTGTRSKHHPDHRTNAQ